MAESQLISSDSHVSEPPDLWVERLDIKYRDRAPRLVRNPQGQEGAYFIYEGYPPYNLTIGLGAGRTPEELAAFRKTGTYADACPGGWDSPQRLPDMELDGVEAEVLYTIIARDFKDVSKVEKRKIVRENAAQLYGFDLD